MADLRPGAACPQAAVQPPGQCTGVKGPQSLPAVGVVTDNLLNLLEKSHHPCVLKVSG